MALAPGVWTNKVHSATPAAPACSLRPPAAPQVPVGRVAVSYEEQATRRKRHAAPTTPPSTLPSADEADALLDLDRDLFTDDAWQGMQRYTYLCLSCQARHAEG